MMIAGGSYMGDLLFDIGVLFFVAVIVFHAVTLPVEFNASNRALDQMQMSGIIYEEEERGAKKVLKAAAMTYVASLAVAIANLLRILAMRGSRD
jgi:Zn-dependent membrane protease YugP